MNFTKQKDQKNTKRKKNMSLKKNTKLGLLSNEQMHEDKEEQPIEQPVKQSFYKFTDLPFVSVCTPTFNRRPFIEYMIKCFLNQDYPWNQR